jgi:hypothetical protein
MYVHMCIKLYQAQKYHQRVLARHASCPDVNCIFIIPFSGYLSGKFQPLKATKENFESKSLFVRVIRMDN